MSERVCDDPDCSFALTGVCARSYADPEECPQHKAALIRLVGSDTDEDEAPDVRDDQVEAENDVGGRESAGTAVLSAPEEKPMLPRSGTLGLRDLDVLMRDRYVHLIGVIGLPNAGKTACVASLYLLLAHGTLKGFSYANSRTLVALDEIARGARRWNEGNSPDQMTVHTELADDRQAGFLHLRLKREDGTKLDLVLPDLPGEWSRRLIANGDAARLNFLPAAEVLWVMVNGRDFAHDETRQVAIHNTTNLIERLANVLPVPRPRMILVASWRDEGDFPASALDRIRTFAEPLGFEIEFASIASFSDNDDVEPGAGLSELIELSLKVSKTRLDPWPAAEAAARGSRAFLDFGRRP